MLSHVTFTGWDRHTDLDDLAAFLDACPQERVEIAVLHSASHIDEDRYPDVDKAVAILRAAKAAGQRSAVHLCGRIARAFLNYSDGLVAASPLIRLADRVQVNVDEGFWRGRGDQRYRRAYELAHILGRPVIVQSRDLNAWPDVEPLAPDASRLVPFLFDRSAGAGVEMIGYPEPPAGRLVGYAGGLGPGNIAELVSKLALRGAARFWVDMESGIREDFPAGARRPDEPPVPSYVSIARCQQVIDAVRGCFGP